MRRLLAALALLVGLTAAGTAEAQNRFWLENHSGMTIREAYVSASRVDVWGPDILGASVLPPGQRVWVTPTFGDCILDVRVVYMDGRAEERRNVNACGLSRIVFGGGAGAGAIVGGGGDPSFNFVNGTGFVIREIYASSARLSSWGPDRLGANVLGPGQSVYIALPASGGCLTDIRVVFMNGAAQERRNFNTCPVGTLTWR
ncbi:MAG: Tat pathway signal protein [Acetobacteraceae bacterium]|nr:Tat pathway signal protein [Acetobacteraceae bacterium]MCX7685068.1 Tat pathway signal protein [Acetobacteraceae bacterium]MDW8398351.1 Tat pathway signal protein [Acetobacteraceae bacterium]